MELPIIVLIYISIYSLHSIKELYKNIYNKILCRVLMMKDITKGIMKFDRIGKQTDGQSPFSIKRMAEKAIDSILKNKVDQATDVGGGKGEFCEYFLKNKANKVFLLDDFIAQNLPDNVQSIKSDLNTNWPLEDNSIDLLVSLEVIEHLENPRDFFRNIDRVLKSGGIGFVSTPNNTNFFSRLNFALKGEHRYFKDNSYPAHITPLTTKEIKRIIKENNLKLIDTFYNYEDVIPIISKSIHITSPLFSSSLGILFSK